MGNVKDENNFDEVYSKLEELFSKKINIGILGSADSEIKMIAEVNEYGMNIGVTDKMRNYLASQGLFLRKDTTHIVIPERSFIRGGFDKNKETISDYIIKQVGNAVEGTITIDKAFHLTGEMASGLIQKYLIDTEYPKNHRFTLEQKSPRTNPLVDSGRLNSSIAYEVVRK